MAVFNFIGKRGYVPMIAGTLLTMFEYVAENETMSVKQDKRKRLHLPKNEKSYLVDRKS